ncbi:bacillithiol biosynthesis cysteine-adding enzyme BshC [Bryobacter aggregatus]|uniref:bacillithiol biosynthesis cysteine-adding enzyme BshC n=1 Tax=Bryobacter aggregatus TaxID=360054 RepID=UPI0004E122FC|nr:bacillithiol biosynthesis cysteine-adding enzyme BshC [Bryobacter aggregatus]
MNGACIRHNELPGSSRLFVDLVSNFPRVAPFYAHDPSDPESLPRAIAEIDYPDQRRAAVAQALAVLNAGNPSLELFAQPGTVAVLTGQQVGLYGGPVYTLYKALSAIKTARELTAKGTPAVPIFWLATEDHDVEEIRSAAFWDRDITADAKSDGRPAGNHLLAGLPDDLPLSDEIAALAHRHYVNGRSFGQSFLGMLQELLAPLGLLFADPLEPTLRAAGAPFLSQAAEKAVELGEAVLERNRALIQAGYHAQVHFERDHTSFFFLLENGQREHLIFHSKTYDAAAMAAKGVALSPNALLRPVWQDWLFPTAALIGGPGELAYFAQSEVLYRILLGRMPVVVPRAFFTIVDSKTAKIVEKFRVRYADMLQSEEHVRETLAKRLVPPDLTESLHNAENSINRAFSTLGAKLENFDPTLSRALDASLRKVRYQFAKNHTKVVREMLRKSEQTQRQAAHISHRLAPHGHLQERHYSLLALLSDSGPDFIPTILENIHTNCFDHQVLLLG